MSDLNYKICPENHYVSCETWNYARDFSDGDVDAMTLYPCYESGLYCYGCHRAYGLSKLSDKSSDKIIETKE